VEHAGSRPGQAEEGLGGRHVVVLAQQSVGRITVAVDDAVEKAPAAAILQVGLVGMPRSATSSMFTPTALPELGGQNGCEFRLPIAQRPMAEYDAALQDISLRSDGVGRWRKRQSTAKAMTSPGYWVQFSTPPLR
jgi:hypothetical protein